MRFKYDANKKLILKMNDNGVDLTISFSENPNKTDSKQTIVDLLMYI